MSDPKDLQTIHNLPSLGQEPTDSMTHNALLCAAAPILIQSGHLRHLSESTREELCTQLIQSIEQFMHDGQAKQYSAPILLAGRYFLCATLDELLAHSTWGKQQEWEKLTLLSFLKQEPRDSNRFFLILQRACENPKEHIDLIELGFHCLSIGFMGEYKEKANGTEIISKLMDKLYQMIIDTRGEPPAELFLGSAPSIHTKTKRISWSCNRRFAFLTWGACIALFFFALFPYKSKLDSMADPIHQVLKTLTQPQKQR
jgi:type VI secretion system protein ImpK